MRRSLPTALIIKFPGFRPTNEVRQAVEVATNVNYEENLNYFLCNKKFEQNKQMESFSGSEPGDDMGSLFGDFGTGIWGAISTEKMSLPHAPPPLPHSFLNT